MPKRCALLPPLRPPRRGRRTRARPCRPPNKTHTQPRAPVHGEGLKDALGIMEDPVGAGHLLHQRPRLPAGRPAVAARHAARGAVRMQGRRTCSTRPHHHACELQLQLRPPLRHLLPLLLTPRGSTALLVASATMWSCPAPGHVRLRPARPWHCCCCSCACCCTARQAMLLPARRSCPCRCAATFTMP